MTVLDAEAVERIFVECLAPSSMAQQEGTKGRSSSTQASSGSTEVVEGIVHKFLLEKDSVAAYKSDIRDLLMELPDQFRLSAGGGWSFLNACMDRHNNQWTGLHATMEKLFVLGIAAGLVEVLLPRDMWPSLPGGMPYYVIKDKEPA